MCPAKDHFICLTLLIMSMSCVLSLAQMSVLLSLHVMLSILLSIIVCVHLYLQADGKVDFEEIPPRVWCISRQACHDFSLYICVLVLVLETVALSQVYT